MMHLRPAMAKQHPGHFSGTVCGEVGDMTDDSASCDCPLCLHWHNMANMDEFTAAYVTTALWSSNDESNESGGDPLDKNYSEQDIAPEFLTQIIADCAKFQKEQGATMQAAIETGQVKYGPDFGPMGRAGHDFWLTRNGHGAGFWDGDWPEPYADQLTKAAKAFREINPYVGDDKKIYAM